MNKIIEATTDVFLRGEDTERQKEQFSNFIAKIASSDEINISDSIIVENVYANLRKYSKTVYIRNLDDPRLVLKREMPITIDFSDNVFTAVSYDLEEFGIGKDEIEALKDIRDSIVSLYYMLKKEEHNLGPLPRRQWEYLKDLILEK